MPASATPASITPVSATPVSATPVSAGTVSAKPASVTAPSVKPASITLVVAYAANRTIGLNNTLPWKLPADLAHFKRTTLGRPILMGRKTWESLGRPLPGRRNMVISRNADYAAPGAEVFESIEAALHACDAQDDVCVIGGAQIYDQALPIATRIEATEIQAEVEGDAHFVALPEGVWKEQARLPQPEENGWRFDFVTYIRQEAL